jgi:hypothetical protein
MKFSEHAGILWPATLREIACPIPYQIFFLCGLRLTRYIILHVYVILVALRFSIELQSSTHI